MKLAAIAALVFMGYWIKYLLSKNARLEHKDKINDKLNDIREGQKDDKQEVLKDEKERIDKRVKDSSGDKRRDRAGRL